MLSLEIEYLNGVSYAATFEDMSKYEWPPHPDRVFSALVASYGEGEKEENDDNEEAAALQWLERQEPPDIVFPDVYERTQFKSYMPVSSNSAIQEEYLKTTDSHNRPVYIYDIRQSLVKKERFFPAVILPDDCRTVYMLWESVKVPPEYYEALCRLASRVSRLGHSASLVRVMVATKPAAETSDKNMEYKAGNRYVYGNSDNNDDGSDSSCFFRCPTAGRFEMLKEGYKTANTNDWHPDSAVGRPYREFVPPLSSEDTNDMNDDDWFILSFTDRHPALESFPLVAKRMRDAIMANIGLGVHQIISGHDADGTPLRAPHMAVVPMANVGYGRYSDGVVLGIGLVLPRKSAAYGTEERRQLRRAVAGFLRTRQRNGQQKPYCAGVLYFGRYWLELEGRRDDDGRKSLQPDRYIGRSRGWSTVTPVILDKYPKANRKDAEAIIAEGCVNAGLPCPRYVDVSRWSMAGGGVPPAFAASGGGGNGERGWKTNALRSLRNRFICHATITFDEHVRGPVLLGAGRYYGMGLFIKNSRQVGGLPT